MGERTSVESKKKVPLKVFGTVKPKDGDDYTWLRVRGGFKKIAKGEPPADLFPPEAGPLVTEAQHDKVLRGTGSSAAHIAQAEEDKEE